METQGVQLMLSSLCSLEPADQARDSSEDNLAAFELGLRVVCVRKAASS